MSALTANTRTVVNGDAAKPASETSPAVARPLTETDKKSLTRAQKQELQHQEAEPRTKAVLDAKVPRKRRGRRPSRAKRTAAVSTR